MSAEETARAHILITGKVQGVGFRAFAQYEGVNLGLTGWVSNVGYDEVECVVEGARPALEAFIESLRRGPRTGRVEHLGVEWLPASHEFTSLKIRASR
ncbi:MAG: acylphosphatase [Anaerolineae bacterium CG_4_9_14_3_um_filter_57_17]|nr:acylphosphatase [bacterium]NCT20122.1 acylphosphatase [bacterium]OIO85237.1 MAG: hypothetical protein AUK01_06555 [Anaerolineae bacterium CG2_30_57_67]PJB64260.1 MAG: acylphosphatase [Anaerolineae bacterium CG_4_9_14_3_um_filter_57_17]